MSPPEHSEPPLEVLSPYERQSFKLIDWLYRTVPGATEKWLRGVSAAWMTWGSKHMMFPVGLERLAGLDATNGVLLVSNHRSFFDLYMLLLLLQRHTALKQKTINPVRGDFFYTGIGGTLVNLIVGAGRMYPPFFRDPSKQRFNKWALEHIASELAGGSILVGFHPEGTRNKNADPYEPLPAQPGVGKLIMESWPIVIPAFINGIGNNFTDAIRDNLQKKSRVVAVFGAPIDLTPFRHYGNRLTSHKRIADAVLKRIYELGEEERAYRAKIEAFESRTGDGKISGTTFKAD